jgi:outer membrane lipoprotein-sorting protein
MSIFHLNIKESSKWFFIIIALVVTMPMLSAQKLSGKSNHKDPETEKILKKIKKEFDQYKSLEIVFDLEIEFPGSETEKQKGKLIQEGKKYFVQTDQIVIISDGINQWFINKSAKEGQINKVGGDDGLSLYSPIELMKIYEKDDHHIGLVNEYKEKGQLWQQIEFVPTDRGTDYSKARLTILKGSNQISEVRFFNRDGSKLVLKVKSMNTNKPVVVGQFAFNKAQYPGVFMEDLR